MGITYVQGTVSRNGQQATLEFLVDSGATYTLLPQEVCRKLDLKPKRRQKFSLADGTTVERAISECHIQLAEGEGHTPVIMGEADDQPLLGMVTLGILGLVLNPFNRTLVPMRMLLV